MLNVIGDILNWLAAAVLFPLLLLPLASLIARRSAAASVAIWLILVGSILLAGIAYAELAPRLGPANLSRQLLHFAPPAVALAVVIALGGGVRRASSIVVTLVAPAVRAVGRGAMWLVALMALIQFVVVILRYVFGLNFIFVQESITYMHGAVFLLAAGYALLTDDHVRVDILYRTASPRRQALIDFIGAYLFLFPVCLLMLWASGSYVGSSWAVREGSAEQSGIQAVFVLKAMIPAFAVLLAMAGFVRAAKAGEVLRGEA